MARGRRAVVLAMAAVSALLLVVFGTSQTPGFISATNGDSRPAQDGPRGLLRGSRVVESVEGFVVLPAAVEPWGMQMMIARLAAAAAVIVGVWAGATSPSKAFFGLGKSGEIIGEIPASGMVFKDTLDVERITDPKVDGVTLYQTDFSKTALDKMMAGNLLQADSGSSGLACIANGPVLIPKDMNKNKEGEEIFSENKGIGKAVKVRRVYDERSKNLVYVVYTERFQKSDNPDGSRFKSVACAIHVTGEK